MSQEDMEIVRRMKLADDKIARMTSRYSNKDEALEAAGLEE